MEVEWRAFELHPELPPEGGSLGYDPERTKLFRARLQESAEEAGMRMRFADEVSNARLALEATEYARTQGKLEAFHRGVFDAYFGNAENIGDPDVLAAVATAHGLTTEAGDDLPIRDWEEGKARGVIGSPHFFTPGGDWFCPSLDVSRADDGHLQRPGHGHDPTGLRPERPVGRLGDAPGRQAGDQPRPQRHPQQLPSGGRPGGLSPHRPRFTLGPSGLVARHRVVSRPECDVTAGSGITGRGDATNVAPPLATVPRPSPRDFPDLVTGFRSGHDDKDVPCRPIPRSLARPPRLDGDDGESSPARGRSDPLFLNPALARCHRHRGPLVRASRPFPRIENGANPFRDVRVRRRFDANCSVDMVCGVHPPGGFVRLPGAPTRRRPASPGAVDHRSPRP